MGYYADSDEEDEVEGGKRKGGTVVVAGIGMERFQV